MGQHRRGYGRMNENIEKVMVTWTRTWRLGTMETLTMDMETWRHETWKRGNLET